MCGRKSLTKGQMEIMEELMVDEWQMENYKPKKEIFPTNVSPILIQNEEKRIIKPMRWGLIPIWSKDMKFGSKIINARAETLREKPSFRNLLNTNRCIVIADGFYEWKTENGKKQKYFFNREDLKILKMAGLWRTWKSPEGNRVDSYTIITTEARPPIADYHHRMPVLLKNSNHWLKRINFSENFLAPNLDGLQIQAK